MQQLGRELRSSEQDYTFDHVVAPMEVQGAHQTRIKYPVKRKDLGFERAGRTVVIKFYKLNAVVALGQQLATGHGSSPPRHQTYPNGIGGATPSQVIYVTVKGYDGDIQRASSFPPLVADLNINARGAHLFQLELGGPIVLSEPVYV